MNESKALYQWNTIIHISLIPQRNKRILLTSNRTYGNINQYYKGKRTPKNPQGGKKMARAKKDDYAERYILSLALASNKKEKVALINRIYEDGFIDGLEAEK